MPGFDQGMPAFMPIVMVLIALIVIIPFMTIFSKAGYSKWLGLLMVVPVVNIIALYFLAFSNWSNLPQGK